MAYEAEFEEFWRGYPLKRDRLDALKAYQKARKAGVTQAVLLAGVEAYAAHKPDWQAWKHAATWINKGGYLDEWQTQVRSVPVVVDWFDECKIEHGGACGLDRYRHMTRMQFGPYPSEVA